VLAPPGSTSGGDGRRSEGRCWFEATLFGFRSKSRWHSDVGATSDHLARERFGRAATDAERLSGVGNCPLQSQTDPAVWKGCAARCHGRGRAGTRGNRRFDRRAEEATCSPSGMVHYSPEPFTNSRRPAELSDSSTIGGAYPPTSSPSRSKPCRSRAVLISPEDFVEQCVAKNGGPPWNTWSMTPHVSSLLCRTEFDPSGDSSRNASECRPSQCLRLHDGQRMLMTVRGPTGAIRDSHRRVRMGSAKSCGRRSWAI
jgi:hypothetical protein